MHGAESAPRWVSREAETWDATRRRCVRPLPTPVLRPVAQRPFPLLLGAVGAAEHAPLRLDPVPDDRARAVRAPRRNRRNRTLEAVEHMPLPLQDQLERLVVLVSTNLTMRHRKPPSAASQILSRQGDPTRSEERRVGEEGR